VTPQIYMMARILADERTAQLRKVDEFAWMREETESDFVKSPIRPAGVIAAILALAAVGQMILI
jgi:hypothetical protein